MISCTNPIEIVDKFNSYFTSIGPDLASKISISQTHISTFMKQRNSNSMFLSPTCAEEVVNIVKLLKNKRIAGVDALGLDIMKKSISVIAKPLSFIINQSLETGRVPESIKIAKVVPIYKNGLKSDITSYQPISVLQSFQKFMRKLLVID